MIHSKNQTAHLAGAPFCLGEAVDFETKKLVHIGEEIGLDSAHQSRVIDQWLAPFIAGSPANLIDEIAREAPSEFLLERAFDDGYELLEKNRIDLDVVVSAMRRKISQN